MNEKDLPEKARRTLTRRGVLEWLGKATVIGLGAPVIEACTRSSSAGGPSLDAGTDAADDVPDDAHDAAAEVEADGPDDPFPFRPGSTADSDIFDSWGERTVDSQDLAEILASWTLRVDGLVESPRTFTFAQLVALARQDQVTDLHCVEGWSVYDVPWNGVHLSTVFDIVRPTASATHTVLHTVGERYNESHPIEISLEPRTMLAYGIDGNTIPLRHGFPLRVVIPRLLGYKNAKFVTRIELADHPVEGFWVAAGYPYAGEVPESRLRPGKY